MSKYNRKDNLYQEAKASGLASRAAFKLEELQKKFRLISSGDNVIELGAWPGGWTQVALRLVGGRGKVRALDLKEIELAADNLEFRIADVLEPETLDWLQEEKASCVISDMSPKLTGIKFRDQALSGELAERALEVACSCLNNNGSLVVKVFPGPEEVEFVNNCKQHFNKVSRQKLKSSRNTSSEIYVIAQGYNQ